MRRMISAIVIMASFSLGAAFPVAENGKAKCVIVHPDRMRHGIAGDIRISWFLN